MKMKAKLTSLLLVAALAATVFSGCTGGDGNTPVDEGDTGASASQAEEDPFGELDDEDEDEPTDTAGGEDGLQIVIVTSPSGVDDGSFNQDNYNGILAFLANNPGNVKTVQETNISNSVEAVGNVLADYDVIVTPGFQFAGISTFAVDNPEKLFILVDSYPTDVDDPESEAEYQNIYAMTFAEEESGFFAGIAAALETETNKVAVVNGIAYPSNVNYQYGFMSGVNYANAVYGTEAEIVEIAAYAGTDVTGTNVGGNYVGDFNDEPTGKVVGKALIDAGCDIIFVAAGNSGNGVFTAAKEAEGVMVIGCDVDQYDDGANGDSNIVLTSALKVMSINVERALIAANAGIFEGGNVLLRADTDSTGYVKADGRHQMDAETVAALDQAYELVKDGTIEPAANFNGHTPENFPGLG